MLFWLTFHIHKIFHTNILFVACDGVKCILLTAPSMLGLSLAFNHWNAFCGLGQEKSKFGHFVLGQLLQN